MLELYHGRQVSVWKLRCLLKVGIQVNLDDAVADGSLELLLGAAGATVEDQEQRLRIGGTNLPFGVRLVLAQELGVQLDVSGLVHAVDIAEACGNREVGRNGGQGSVDIVDIFGLGVERVVVDASIVDSVLLTTGNANFL